MYKIFLDENLFNYLIENLEDDKMRKSIIGSKKKEDKKVYFKLDVDTKIDLMDYVEDLQLQIGVVDGDYLNDDGKKLQQIYDEIYNQTN